MDQTSQLTVDELLAHMQFIRAVARELVADEWRAADLVQQTLLQAATHPPAARTGIRSWLARIALNLVRQSAREEGRRLRRERLVARPDATASTAELVERLELQRLLVEAVLEQPIAGAFVGQQIAYWHDRGSPGPKEAAILTAADESFTCSADERFFPAIVAWKEGFAPLQTYRPKMPSS